MAVEICETCNQPFDFGENGTIAGCDRCTGVERDRDGYAWERGEETQTRVSVVDRFAKPYVVTRAEAFEGVRNG